MELAIRELILCFYTALYGEIVAEGPDDARVARFTAFYTSALDIFFSVWLRPMLLRGILTDNPVHAHPHAHEPALFDLAFSCRSRGSGTRYARLCSTFSVLQLPSD